MTIAEATKRHDDLTAKKAELSPVREKIELAIRAIEKEQAELSVIIDGQTEPTTDDLVADAESTLVVEAEK